MNKEIILIAYYWYPWNNSGTFRWIGFGRYIDFDVLTSSKPIKSFNDPSIPIKHNGYVYRFGKNLPAVLWGILASICIQFIKRDIYIITAPPESLIFGAWLLQIRGKKVLFDLRDHIDRDRQKIKILIPLYKFFYSKLKTVIVPWKYTDPTKIVIRTGYDEVEMCPRRKVVYYDWRYDYKTYLSLLMKWSVPSQKNKPKGYLAGTLNTFKYYGIDPDQEFNEEFNDFSPTSFNDGSAQILKILKELK